MPWGVHTSSAGTRHAKESYESRHRNSAVGPFARSIPVTDRLSAEIAAHCSGFDSDRDLPRMARPSHHAVSSQLCQPTADTPGAQAAPIHSRNSRSVAWYLPRIICEPTTIQTSPSAKDPAARAAQRISRPVSAAD